MSTPASPPAPRQCGDCTACCDGWVQTVIAGVAVYPGCACPHSTGKGCAIYAERPRDPCINFNCGWLIEHSPLPDWMKPDAGKLIVLFGKLRWQERPVDLAVPVGASIPQPALDWLRQFAERHGRLLVYTEQIIESGRYSQQQTVYGYGPPAFQDDLARWQREGRKLW